MRPRNFIEYIPAGIRSQPMESFFVAIGLPSGVLSLLGLASSKSLDASLPWLLVKAWSLLLIVGCLAWTCGISGVKLNGDALVITRSSCYRFGLHLLSLASVVYSLSILFVTGWGGVLAAWPLLALAGASYLKSADLDRMRRRYQYEQEQEGKEPGGR